MIVGLDIGGRSTKVALRAEDGTIGEHVVPSSASKRELMAHLLEGHGPVDGLAAAVPDAWYDGDLGGARRLEELRRELAEELGLPLRRVAGQAVCAAAGAGMDHGHGPARLLLCDVGADGVRAALCDIETGSVRLLDVEARDGPAGADFDVRLLQAALAPGGTGPNGHRQADLVQVLLAARQARQRRAAVVLARAAQVRRYRDTPVYWFDADDRRYVLSAGQVLDGFGPIAATIRGALGALLARHADLQGGTVRIAIAGGLGGFPLVPPVVADTLGQPLGGPTAAPALLDQAAAARGALLITEGSVAAPDPVQASLDLSVHRVFRGRLTSSRVPLGNQGSAAAVEADGAPLVVEVPWTDGRPVLLEIRRGGQGEPRELVLAPIALPSGRYHVALWPTRSGHGTMVFRPVGGGEPYLHPLVESSDRRSATSD